MAFEAPVIPTSTALIRVTGSSETPETQHDVSPSTIRQGKALAKRMLVNRRDDLERYHAFGKFLLGLKTRYPHTTRFGQFLKEHIPEVAKVRNDLRSKCLWLAKHEAKVLEAFGWESLESSPWQHPQTIQSKYKALLAEREDDPQDGLRHRARPDTQAGLNSIANPI